MHSLRNSLHHTLHIGEWVSGWVGREGNDFGYVVQSTWRGE